MEKKDFAKMALMGLAGGLLISGKIAAGSIPEDQNEQKEELLAKLRTLTERIDARAMLAASQTSPSSTAAPSKNEKNEKNSESKKDDQYVDSGNLGYHVLSQDELLLELNDEGTRLYNSLSPKGKELAREVASQRCNGTNLCKGLNGCETEHNKCAGQGSCKGQSKCAISDKNLAVKLVWLKMHGKRLDTAGSN